MSFCRKVKAEQISNTALILHTAETIPMANNLHHLLIQAMICLFLYGCGTATQHIAPIENIDERLAVTQDGDFESMMAEAENHWSQRSDREHTEQAIAIWEELLHVESPGDRRADLYPVLHKLSRAYYFLTDGHIRFEERPDWEEAMKSGFQQGLEYGHLALSVNNEDWNRALLYETPISEAVNLTTLEDLPAMYWYSTNMGKWAILDGIATILAHKDDIAAIMGRVATLDRSFLSGASDRYFGVYWTKLPIGNPDLARSREHFETAISMEPNYLSARVLFAEGYAIKAQDRAVFEEQLNYVINADPAALPHLQPENEIEQRKAQILLDNIDEYFR